MRVSMFLTFVTAFFLFATATCALTLVMLSVPGSRLDGLWRLNPDAHRAFHDMGPWAFVTMAMVGIACALSAAGVALRREWGRRIAITVFSANLVGDVANATLGDLRTLIGLPISAAVIALLMHPKVRERFRLKSPQHE